MAITEIYSGATNFGLPIGFYFVAYLIVMIMFLGPTLISVVWVLAQQRGGRPALRLVRPLGRVGRPRFGKEKRPTRAA